MISFRKFIRESAVIATKRRSITHLQDMKPIQFHRLLQKIGESGGKLSGIEATLKVDGASGRFGKDESGQFFFETGGSGPIQRDGAFFEFTKEKTSEPEVLERAKHYDEIYQLLSKSDLAQGLPDGVKIVCEVLYNPMAEAVGSRKLKFVSVEYDRKRLGDPLTIIPISVIEAATGDPHADSSSILKKLQGSSSVKIMIITPDLGAFDLDVNDAVESLGDLNDGTERLLRSRAAADKAEKQALIDKLDEAKDKIAKQILDHPFKRKTVLGSEIEGIIVTIDGEKFKVTTDKFKQEKKAERERENLKI